VAHRLPEAVVPRTRDFARTAFGPFTRRILRALGEALFVDPDREDAPPDRFDWMVEDCDDMIAHASDQLRYALCFSLVVLELLPLFAIGRFARMSSLPLEERERYLARLESSRLPYVALLLVGLKSVLSFVYFEHPYEMAKMGYDGRHVAHLRVKS
jgi:hypothetical protein